MNADLVRVLGFKLWALCLKKGYSSYVGKTFIASKSISAFL
jgi:hypothetical protein